MAVHAQEFDVFAVQIEYAVFDFDSPEAHEHPLGLAGDFRNQLVAVGRFRCPGLRVFDFGGQARFAVDHITQL